MKKCALFLIITTLISGVISFAAPTKTYADSGFFGLPQWNDGVEEVTNANAIKDNVVIIATNILAILTQLSGYIAMGYVIYGGYLYMFSSGDPGKAIAGKKTLTRAFIGLAIVGSAYVIVSTIRIALFGGKLAPNGDVTTLIKNAFNYAIGISGVISAAFLVYGGISYMTAAGDPGKLAKAKKAIQNSLIGLTIVGLAGILTNFVIDTTNDAVEGKATQSEEVKNDKKN